ncbi:MAG TPA: glycosyl transferase [Deltaproteobacteria bacterium]|jgi:glycosyltransferase involved in cell wall biosynthesis|nr:MAG: glycosyltransferase family 1 protein [Pseudomonadota bacterium]HBM53277.1 glycosyl transferase [Deltaproteobacteria bacterium]|tara:strand:+ start:3424 stop:4608 length:1185 start_codon:yes stop_codon:yes gene_type:complete
MRILITSNVRWWNAEAAYAATLARELLNAGHKVWVLTLPNSLNETKLRNWNLPIITDIPLSSSNPWQLWRAYRRLQSLIEEQQIQIVNAHRSEGFPLLVLLRQRLKSFALIRTRGTTRPLRDHWLNRKLHEDWIESVIVPAQVIASQLRQILNLPSERLQVIYYPVNPSSIDSQGESEAQQSRLECLDRLGIPRQCRVIGIVGRIRPVKGQRILLKSFATLRKRFPDIVLLMLYRDTNETEAEWQGLLQDLVESNLQQSVYLYGYREDVLEIMRHTDIGVVSSVDSEVICRVAVEFFSVGKPVIAFPTGALPEIIQDGVTGRIAKDKSAEALAEILEWMLESPERISEFGKNARQQSLERFDPNKLLEQTLSVYEQSWQHLQSQLVTGEANVRP